MRVGLLGPVEMSDAGRGFGITSAKQRGLIALLALNAGTVVSADRLIEGLWGEGAGGDALNALRHHVSRLRKQVGAMLVTRASGYLLDLEPDQVDALQFARLLTDARTGLQQDQTHDEVAATLRRALVLWRGAPLVEFLDHDWARQEATRLEQLYLAAIEDRIHADLALGRHADLVNELQGLVREHSFRERLWGQLMLALYRCGRQTDALAAFQDVRRMLAEENGLDPGPELARLELAILAHDPQLAVPARPLTPAAEAPQTTSSNLPTPLTSFIGRHDQVVAIRALLDGSRLVTLTGPPGVGKTRLAVEVGRAVQREFLDGVWLIELAPLSDRESILDSLATRLGLRRPGAAAEASPLADVLEYLRNRRALLIVDNCEHVLGFVARLVELVLAGCADVRVLATSREPLGMTGEAQQPVSPLSLPTPGVRDPRELLGSEAVRLFEERAMKVRPDFAVTPQTAPAVADVCRALDGLPLAIELAAARVKVLPVSHIASALGDRFRLLVAGSRTSPPRQQTLRAAVDWSYELLDDDERRLFERLSLFAGGCSLNAAERVGEQIGLGAFETLDILGRLVDKSMVVAAVGTNGQPRYQLLETLRVYGVERLVDSAQYEQAYREHAELLANMAERAEREMRGPERLAWLRTLHEELDNLRGVLHTALTDREATMAVRVAGALGFFFSSTNRTTEGRNWLEAALAIADDTTPALWHARAKNYLSPVLVQYGDFQRAIDVAEQGLALAIASGDAWQTAYSKATLALTFNASGHAERTSPLLGEARAAFELIDESRGDWGVAHCEFVTGLAAVRVADVDAVERAARELRIRARRIQYDLFEGWSYVMAGWVAERRADLASAETEYLGSLQLVRRTGLNAHISFMVALLGRLALRSGQLERARARYSEASMLVDDGASPWFAAFTHAGVAATLWRSGESGQAEAAYRQAIAESPITGSTFSQERFFGLFGGSPAARAQIALGTLVSLRGEDAEAQSLLVAGLEGAERDGDAEAIALAFEGLAAAAAKRQRDAEGAATLLAVARAVRDKARVSRDAFDTEQVAATTATVRAALNLQTLERATRSGSSLSLSDALALARRMSQPVPA